MRAAASLFGALVVRHALAHKARTALTLASVAIGVAVTVAVRLANASAIASFSSTANMVAGGTVVQVVSNGDGLADRMLLTVRAVDGVASAAPIVSGTLTDEPNQAAYEAIGIDLLAALGMASGDGAPSIGGRRVKLAPTILERGRIIISASLARRLHADLGRSLTLTAGSRPVRLSVGGIVDDAELPLAARSSIFCDLSTAQETFGRPGLLDRIDVVPAAGVAPAALRARLRAALPGSVSFTTPADRAGQLAKMVSAFAFNLAALAAIALLVGAFLLFNAVSMSVVQRNAEIGTARAVGTTRRTIFAIFLLEGAAVGVLGSALGVALGRLLASGALRAVAGTVDALYASSKADTIVGDAATYALAFGLGLLLALAAAVLPALDAAGVAPSMTVRQGAWEVARRLPVERLLAYALGLFFVAAVLTRLPPLDGRPIFGYAAALLLVLGCSVLGPPLVLGVAALARAALPSFAGAPLHLAPQNLRGRARRNGVAVASLMIGVAMTVSVSTMIDSFRTSVNTWIDRTLRGDLYVRPAGAVNSADVTMSAAPAERLRSLPSVAAVDVVRSRLISYRGRLTYVAASDMRVTSRYGELPLISHGRWSDVARRLIGRRSVVVSEPFGRKFGLKSGDTLSLPTARGAVAFSVIAIYEDYSSDLGYAFMDIGSYRYYYHDAAVNGMAVYGRPNADLSNLRAAVRSVFGAQSVSVQSNRELRASALVQFERTFAVTHVLDAIALSVALMGIVATLAALVIERRVELGVLRCLGMTARQTLGMIVAEAALLGAMGAALGTAAGYALAAILVFIINPQAFGWTIAFVAVPLPDAELAAGVVATAALAGLIPAAAAASTPVAQAVRAE